MIKQSSLNSPEARSNPFNETNNKGTVSPSALSTHSVDSSHSELVSATPAHLISIIQDLTFRLKQKTKDAELAASLGQELLRKVELQGLSDSGDVVSSESSGGRDISDLLATPTRLPRNSKILNGNNPSQSTRKNRKSNDTVDYNDTLSGQQDRIRLLQDQIDSLESQLRSQKQQNSQLKDSSQKEIKQLENSVWELERMNQVISAETAQLKHKIDKLNQENKDIRLENRRLSERLEVAYKLSEHASEFIAPTRTVVTIDKEIMTDNEFAELSSKHLSDNRLAEMEVEISELTRQLYESQQRTTREPTHFEDRSTPVFEPLSNVMQFQQLVSIGTDPMEFEPVVEPPSPPSPVLDPIRLESAPAPFILPVISGFWALKFTRKSSIFQGQRKVSRFVWINPSAKRLFYSKRDPNATGVGIIRVKSFAILGYRIVNDTETSTMQQNPDSSIGAIIEFSTPVGKLTFQAIDKTNIQQCQKLLEIII